VVTGAPGDTVDDPGEESPAGLNILVVLQFKPFKLIQVLMIS